MDRSKHLKRMPDLHAHLKAFVREPSGVKVALEAVSERTQRHVWAVLVERLDDVVVQRKVASLEGRMHRGQARLLIIKWRGL